MDKRKKTARINIGGKTPICYSYLPNTADEESILDFGCGKGQGLKILVEKGYSYTGIDLDTQIKPSLKSFDFVVLSNVINVQSTLEELKNTLDEAFSYLKDEGTFVFNYPISPRKLESFHAQDLIELILSYANHSQKILFVKTSKKAETINETIHCLGRRKNKAS